MLLRGFARFCIISLFRALNSVWQVKDCTSMQSLLLEKSVAQIKNVSEKKCAPCGTQGVKRLSFPCSADVIIFLTRATNFSERGGMLVVSAGYDISGHYSNESCLSYS